MATEKQRLADIEACGRYVAGRIGFRTVPVEDVMAYMADFADKHTVDAVEVVRCKDCEHSEPCICVVCEEGNTMVCRRFLSHVQKDHFCSYGERRTK